MIVLIEYLSLSERTVLISIDIIAYIISTDDHGGSRSQTSPQAASFRWWWSSRSIIALPAKAADAQHIRTTTETMPVFRHDWRHKHGRVRTQRSNQIIVAELTNDSLIAIMLGRLEMTIEECIDNYIEMMDNIFQKTSHRLGFDLTKLDLANLNTKIQGRFDTVELEAAIKRAVIVSDLAEDTKFRRADRDKCKV